MRGHSVESVVKGSRGFKHLSARRSGVYVTIGLKVINEIPGSQFPILII